MSDKIFWEDGSGKYGVVFENGHLKATRYGEEWRDLAGDNLVLSMLFAIEALDAELAIAIDYIQNSGVDWSEIKERVWRIRYE